MSRSGSKVACQRLHDSRAGFAVRGGNNPGAAEGKKHKRNEAPCRSFLPLRNDKTTTHSRQSCRRRRGSAPSDSGAHTFHLFTWQLQRNLENFSSLGLHCGIAEEEWKTRRRAASPESLPPVSEAPCWWRRHALIRLDQPADSNQTVSLSNLGCGKNQSQMQLLLNFVLSLGSNAGAEFIAKAPKFFVCSSSWSRPFSAHSMTGDTNLLDSSIHYVNWIL